MPVPFRGTNRAQRARLRDDDGHVGALVTLQLPPDSPVRELPWIITFGPLTEAEDWEPVVCGPYEWPHALALAEEVVADADLMAVVEPLLGYVAPDEIRAEIAVARAAAVADEPPGRGEPGPDEEWVPDPHWIPEGGRTPDDTPPEGVRTPSPLPSAAEVRAGMARVVRQLAD
jgi:hypothetical protein